MDGRVTSSPVGPQQRADEAVVPDEVDRLVRGTRGAEELAASLTGRWPRTRLLHQYQLPRVEDPGLTLLQTTGPVLGRDLELVDLELVALESGEPLVVATSIELLVPDRLPQAVAEDLTQRSEPLDRLLDEHGTDWDSELIRAVAVRAQAPAVEVLRRIWLDSVVGALVFEEHRMDLAEASWLIESGRPGRSAGGGLSAEAGR